ncbi:MAG: hypothetical protein RJA21_1389 [Gemmatimonadota bacterium]|jgi:hypothetical protein
MVPKRNVYKTKWFAKAARKADIADAELCEAISEVEQGQADDLGGGVWKKRLRKNRWRGIVLTQGRYGWLFAYLFAKADRENIEDDELAAFKKLARDISAYSADAVQHAVDTETWMEVTCG